MNILSVDELSMRTAHTNIHFKASADSVLVVSVKEGPVITGKKVQHIIELRVQLCWCSSSSSSTVSFYC